MPSDRNTSRGFLRVEEIAELLALLLFTALFGGLSWVIVVVLP